MRVFSLGRIAVVTLALGLPVGAQVQDLEARRSAAREHLVEGLREHSGWCRGKKIFLEREKIVQRLLAVVPDDAESLKFLGYKKGRDDVWAPPKKPKKFKDFNKSAVEEAPAHYAECLEPYTTAMRALLDEPALTAEQRKVVVEDFLIAHPDDHDLRVERGEVKADEVWILKETAVSVTRRAELKDLVAEALGSAEEVEADVAVDREEAFGLPWTSTYSTPIARVLGTGSDEEIFTMAATLPATVALLRATLSEEAKLPDHVTVFLLASLEDRDVFLAAHPDIQEAARAAYALTAGSWIDGPNDIVYWTAEEAQRRDGIVRMLISYVVGHVQYLSLEHAWLHEALGLYLTEALTGTRFTWFVQADPLDIDDESSLFNLLIVSEDWRRAAFEEFTTADRPNLPELVDLPLAEFTIADMLYAYVVGAYLLEGQPDSTGRITQRVGAGQDPREVLESELGFPLEVIDERIIRWLDETTAAEDGRLALTAITASSKEER